MNKIKQGNIIELFFIWMGFASGNFIATWLQDGSYAFAVQNSFFQLVITLYIMWYVKNRVFK